MSTLSSTAAGFGEQLVATLGIVTTGQESRDLKGPCLFCSSSDAFRVNKTSGVFHCYACEAGGSPFDLIKHVVGDGPIAVKMAQDLGIFSKKHHINGKSKNGHKHQKGSSAVTSISKAKKKTAQPHDTDEPAYQSCVRPDGKLLGNPVEMIATAKSIPVHAFRTFGARPIFGIGAAFLPSYGPGLQRRGDFTLFTIGGKGKWSKKISDERVAGLFLPHDHHGNPIAPTPGQWCIVEGAKDGPTLYSLGYHTVGLPTCHMHEEFAPLFMGVHVVLVPDGDAPSIRGAKKTAARLSGVAASVRVARLPLELKPSKGGDIRDVIREQGESAVHAAIATAVDAEAFFATPALHVEFEAIGQTLDTSGADDSDGSDDPDHPAEPSIQITNFDLEPDDEGDLKPVPLDMASVLERFSAATGGWPKRLGGSLFVTSGEHVQWLASPASLFGWAGSTTGNVVDWKRGPAFASKEETFSELCRTAESFDAIESLPHAPPLPRHYYTHPPLTPGCGTRLSELIDRFNPETVVDRDLILSMFATLVWGGQGGTRPAFVVTSDQGRGAGKSKLVAMLSLLAGGSVDLSQAEDIGKIKERLLSPEGLARRVVLIDNVKSHRWSWSDLEGLITAPTISGKRLYIGEAARPNTLMWTITLNGVSLSTDLAQRAIVVKLASPPRTPGWEDQTRALITNHRDEILADLVGFFEQEPQPLGNLTRWAAWEHEVLARLPEPVEALKLIKERRAVADVEAEEADMIEDYFRSQLADLHYAVDEAVVHIPAVIATAWLGQATGEKLRTAAATRHLKQLHDEGRLTTIVPNPCRTHGRGVLWWGRSVDVDAKTHYDLETRLAQRRDNKFFN